jgi:formate dehydrogenase subunit delta
MNTSELLRMANQIAGYFQSYPRDEAVTETAAHIRSFWDPRMRKGLLDHVAAGGEGLHDIVLLAAGHMPMTAGNLRGVDAVQTSMQKCKQENVAG